MLSRSNFTELESLKCYSNQLTLLNVDGCTKLRTLDCRYNGLLGTPPEIFDNILILDYEPRYHYKWDYIQDKPVVDIDRNRGYWYPHEPESGSHKRNL